MIYIQRVVPQPLTAAQNIAKKIHCAHEQFEVSVGNECQLIGRKTPFNQSQCEGIDLY